MPEINSIGVQGVGFFGEVPESKPGSRAGHSLDFIKFSHEPRAQIARNHLNSWIEVWPTPGDAELFGHLISGTYAQFQGACWELYLNWLLREHGFAVRKIPQEVDKKTPDFLASKEGFVFIVEATVKAIDEDKLWQELINKLNEIQRSDYCVSIYPLSRDETAPSAKSIGKQIESFLNQLPPPSPTKPGEGLFETEVSSGEWVLHISAIPLGPSANPMPIVAIQQSERVAEVKDSEVLRNKILKKRKRYGTLEYPLIIAILENSFMKSDTHVHRFDAFFGQNIIRFSIGDGSSTMHRGPGGLWAPNGLDQSVSAYLLAHSLPLWLEEIQQPEFWVNPNVSTSGLDSFSEFRTFRLEDGNFGPTSK